MFNTNALYMEKLEANNEAHWATWNFCTYVLSSFSCFLWPLVCLMLWIAQCIYSNKFLLYRNCLASVRPCSLSPLDCSDVTKHSLLLWQWSAVYSVSCYDYRSAPLDCFFPVSSQRYLLFHSIFQVVLLTCLTNLCP